MAHGLEVFLVCADASLRRRVEEALAGQAQVVGAAERMDSARSALATLHLHALLIAQDADCGECFGETAALVRDTGLPVILLIPQPTPQDFRKAMQVGARDLVAIPFSTDELLGALQRAVVGESSTSTAGRQVAVFSTKGGVGKTTLAVNLAIALGERQGRRCALVDLDLSFGNAVTLFGLKPTTTIVDLARQSIPIAPTLLPDIVVPQPQYSVDLLAAPPTPDLADVVDGEGKGNRQRNYVAETLSAFRQSYPWTVIDTASEFREGVLAALDQSETILMVTTPDIPALQNTAKGLDILLQQLSYPTDKVKVVLNRSNSALGLTEEDITRALDYPITYRIPSDGEAAVRSANTGTPLFGRKSRSPLSRAVAELAASLMGDSSPRVPSRPRLLWR